MHRFIAAYSPTEEGRHDIEERLKTKDDLKIFSKTLESRHFTLYTEKIEDSLDEADLKVSEGYAFLGEVYNETPLKKLMDLVLRRDKTLEEALDVLDGKYVFFKTEGGDLTVFRDPLGLKPVYSSKVGHSTFFSSERKLLWGLEATQASSLPPNRVYKIDPHSTSSSVCVEFSVHPKAEDSLEEASDKISEMVMKRTGRLLDGVEEVAVAFSGGVDSSLAARLASIVGKEVVPVVVGLKGSKDFERAETSARQLGFELERVEKKASEMEGDISEAVSLVEEADTMKIGAALPLLWASRRTSEMEVPVILTGQGSDELYGGYARFLWILRERGEGAAEEAIFESVVGSYEVNYERDEKVASSQGSHLRHPLISPGIASYTLRLPLQHKISSIHDEHRKLLIRKVAEKLGVPKEVAWGRKKALQYSTLTDKAIRRIAKKKCLRPKEYLERLFEDVFGRKPSQSVTTPRETRHGSRSSTGALNTFLP